MTINHAPAIIRWREHLQRQGGLEGFEQSYTVSTMLFGCTRYLENNTDAAPSEEREQISTIKMELEDWMRQRGLVFTQ